MAGNMKLYLFGDQTFDTQLHLRDLLQSRHNPLLEDFLVRAYGALRHEIHSLPLSERDRLPRFTCIDDIILRKPGPRCVALDMAVACLYQLSIFIIQLDSRHYIDGSARVLGLCTGALAAAAVSCSRSGLDLIPAAVDAVSIAFRLGKHVSEMARRVAPSSTSDQIWSIILPGRDVSEAAVRRFYEETNLPPTSRPYISACLPNGITVSGPPSSLAQLTSSPSCEKLRSQRIPIYAPYHAPHLYTQVDIDEIVDSVITPDMAARLQQITVLSSTAAVSSLEGGNYGSMLKGALAQILLGPIQWSGIMANLKAWLQQEKNKVFTIAPIGTRAEQIIYNALQQTSLRELITPLPLMAKTPAPSGAPVSHGKAKLAIIGMSGRFPGANDGEAFWDLLYQGLDVHKPVPALHWDAKTHVDSTGAKKNTSATPFGCWLDDPADFDARFFNISPREAPQIDPAQRLALMTAYEAIEQAGIVPDATPSTRRDRVGVFYGVTSNDWMETNSAQNIDTYFIPGGNRAFIPGRINYCFKFNGPSYAVDTACSSSLAGIHIACNALWRGDIDTAIAGGTNVLTNPDFTSGLDRGHFLSRTGNCKTFDDGADGYCRGEGIGTVIIKRLDDAIADKDPILGTILGAYTNHSAEAESITRPHVGAQREIFTKILNQAAVDPYTVSYVEMHGTGTQAGDAGEMSSVLHTFAPPVADAKKARSDAEALYLGSAKANIGHGEAASGVSSLVKVLLMMKKNVIVPHCGIKTKINHRFPTDLKERNVRIALEPTPWERDSDPCKPRRVFVNNFSAAGGNSALLLEDAPVQNHRPVTADPRTPHVVAVSAKNAVSLQGNLKSLLTYLRENDRVDLGKLSYTTTARRQHHQHRVMLTGGNISDICNQLGAAISTETGAKRPKSAPKLVFAFTGQGAQYPGMGRGLFESFAAFRTEMQRLDRIGQSLGFPSFLPVVHSQEQDCSVFDPIVVQLASVSLQIALYKLLASWKIVSTAVVGHSLGEYAALNAAGVLSDTDALYLVGKRAELLQQKCTRDTHSMLVVRGSVDQIASVLQEEQYEVACINSPVETVLAGPNEDIAEYKSTLTNAGLKSTILKVPYAFHSSQIDPILKDFKDIATGVTFLRPTVPIICPSDGSVVGIEDDEDETFDAQFLVDQCREPVNIQKALVEAQRLGIMSESHSTLEIGPHPAVSAMVKAVFGSQSTTLATCQRGKAAFAVLAATLKNLYMEGADICWSAYHKDFEASHEVISLPAYSWDLKQYWMQYVNDWSLRKGDPALTVSNVASNIESTTIHRIVDETDKIFTVEANIARKDLSPLVQGHEVDGIPLCTPSVYCDMALSMGTYILKKHQPDQKENLVDITDMVVSKALILKSGVTEQLLRACGDIDWAKNAVLVRFMSFDSKQKLQEHARCTIRFKDQSYRIKLQQDTAAVKKKMQALRDGVAPGESARFNRPMVYRAIRPLARFHDDYRAIDEILLNSNTLEASSALSYGSVKRGGIYHTHPAVIDSLTQSCGFTMNCNDNCDLDKEVFMNHGWGSLQIYEPMDFDKKYTTYTQMSEGEDKLWHGDVTIFEGDKVVAWFGKIAIQSVPRRVLKVILNIEAGTKKQAAPVTKAVSAPKQTSALKVTEPTVPTPNSSGSGSGKFIKALDIIAEESGLSQGDLTTTTAFSDVGIDSLMCLGICARFNEEIDVDIDFSAFLTEFPTVGDLKVYIGGPESRNSSTSSGATSIGSESAHGSGTSTPTIVDWEEDSPKIDFGKVLNIITEESGVAVEELTNDTNFGDAGVDSLLSLVIVSRMRDELELDVQHESLLVDCPTVGELRTLLVGDSKPKSTGKLPAAPAIPVEEKTVSVPKMIDTTKQKETNDDSTPTFSESDSAELARRKAAVDSLVEKYTAGFTGPTPKASTPTSNDKSIVVLVTGATGSLGTHLVDQLAQMDNISKVVCLNREKSNTDPYQRQQKSMREKGHRSFDKIRSKLLVLQADSAKPKLCLANAEYEELASSVTHLIHQAWPMSAKRGLAGFEPQFQVMRNLIDFARDASSRRDSSFKFTFQLVSSIGVVGHYGLDGKSSSRSSAISPRIHVPEERMKIETVLPNGYSEAKWGCERMLDETLHKYPAHFRAMVARLGQIAGCKVKGYWNPMEHFGFLIKSSQTLNALPDVPGDVFWAPVNDIAGTLADLILLPSPSDQQQQQQEQQHIYHIENPVGQPWKEVNGWLADSLGIPKRNMIPFEEWVERVRKAPQRNNPASTLLHFLDDNYLRMSCGGLVLGTKQTLEHSPTLRKLGPVSEEIVRRYVHIWKEIGFLS